MVYTLFSVWRPIATWPAFDFYHYYVYARIAGRTPVANVYSHDAQREIGEEMYARALAHGSPLLKTDAHNRRFLDTTGSPLFYATFAWLPEDYDLALSLHRLSLLVAFAAAMMILGWRAGLHPALSLTLIALLVRYFFPLMADLLVGNASALQLLSVALFLAIGPRFPAAGGALMVLLVAYKPNFAAILPLLVISRVVTRDWVRLQRELLGGLAGGVAAFAAGSLFFRSWHVWLDWLPVASEFTRRLPERIANNYAPLLPLLERDGLGWSYAAYALLLLLIVGVLAKRPRQDDALIAGLAILVHLLAASTFWVFYAVLALLPAMTLLRFRWSCPVALVCMLLLAAEPVELLLGRPLETMAAWIASSATLLLFGTSLFALARAEDVTTE